MRGKILNAILIAVFILSFCIGCYRYVSPTHEFGVECQKIVDEIEKMTPKMSVTQHYDHDSIHALFDINDYFKVLKNVSIDKGYYIDYIYCAMVRYGRPYIFARRKGEPNLCIDTACSILRGVIWDWDREVLEGLTTQYLSVIKSDGTAMGFFQWVVLYLLGDQFFLFDHAVYDDDIVICTKQKMEDVLTRKHFLGLVTIPEDIRRAASGIDVTPVVEMTGDNTVVKVITFSKWKGFQRRTFVFQNRPIQRLTKKETITLVPYHCGFVI